MIHFCNWVDVQAALRAAKVSSALGKEVKVVCIEQIGRYRAFGHEIVISFVCFAEKSPSLAMT